MGGPSRSGIDDGRVAENGSGGTGATPATQPRPPATDTAATRIAGVPLCQWLKRRTTRPRPCDVHVAMGIEVPAPDRLSLPSGHTLHAVSFNPVATSRYPELASPLFIFAFPFGASRAILGLHHPSDGLVGAVIAELVLSF